MNRTTTKRKNGTGPRKPKRPTDPRASVKGVTIRLPGLAGWHAEMAMELARIADRIILQTSEMTPTLSGRGKEMEESGGALVRMAEQFWKYAGEEVSLFRAPGEGD